MAGGEGTRLRPLTSNVPKPMLPLANRPMMEHIVALLRRHGFDEIVVTVAYLANSIRTYFGDGSEFGVRMVYATEETPLGTAGSVRNAMDELDERFLVISGDVLTDLDLSAILRFHEERDALATIGLVAVDNPLEFGIVITGDDGRIERFLEKPSWGEVFSDTINTGVFVLEPRIFDFIAPEGQVDFSSDVFPALLAAGEPLYGSVQQGYWEDVGTLEAYASAHQDVLDGRVQVQLQGFELGHGVWLGEGVDVHPEAEVQGPALIGDYCRIESGTRLGPYTVLGSNVRVRSGCDLERAIVHENAYLGEGVRVRGATVGRATDLRRGARLDDGVVVGDSCFIGEAATVTSGVKVYPFKTVEAGATVNASIVWESKGARSLFGAAGVVGLANVDVTPELAARVAMAYASTLKKGATVVTSRDSSRAGRMLKRSMMAGFNAAGVDVVDLEVASVPVTRFAVRQPQVSGGVTIRLVEGDAQSVIMRFFDADGLDLSETVQRKVERLLHREDFRRVLAAEIGDISFPPRALEMYTSALESTVDVATVRGAAFKLVVDYGYGSTSFVMPNVLGKLGADVLGVNPYASTAGVLEFDRATHAEAVAAVVRASGAHLGAVLDPDGEHLTLVDDEGRVLSDHESLLAFALLVPDRLVGDVVAVPVSASDAVGRLLSTRGAAALPTRLSTAALMEAACDPRVGFAGDDHGGFILPGFLPAFDGAAALVKLLELLALGSDRLSAVVDRLPTVHLVRGSVITPWDRKGLVMRSLVELAKDRTTELIDGVKVRHEDGWVLVVPDVEEPLTHLWAEADTEARARELLHEYTRRVRQLLR